MQKRHAGAAAAAATFTASQVTRISPVPTPRVCASEPESFIPGIKSYCCLLLWFLINIFSSIRATRCVNTSKSCSRASRLVHQRWCWWWRRWGRWQRRRCLLIMQIYSNEVRQPICDRVNESTRSTLSSSVAWLSCSQSLCIVCIRTPLHTHIRT